ncbi:MAG TPA: outer membrane protein assembly factor BamA [Gammaproteobacteria bacterium]|jgi:outer membrane protein insertion porin family|nr:outer membrane protein assembly factor BamA [Gammaproteobacteria bacterium]
MKKLLLILLFISQLTVSAWADTFVIQNIKVEGLQRVSPATVENYLPVKRGQTLTSAKTAAIMQSLYKTGFFEDINLSRQGGTLVIHVKERPTIGKLDIKGNSIIPSDKLTSVMKSLGIEEGRVYNASLLEKIRQSLLNQYYLLGRYNARVEIKTAPMTRDRIQVTIDISEGVVAKVKSITIIGNHVFKESILVDQLDLSTSNIISIVTQSDRYSEEKLESSLDKLRGYYLDRGYLRFQIKSSQAQITPDRKSVYLTIVVDEGQPYTIESYKIEGKLPLPREEVVSRVKIHSGEVFSRKKVMDTEKDITKYFADNGYLFTNVSIRPDVNDKTRKVVLIFMVNSGKRTYVRHITFSDNNRTNDEVLRREMLQFEASPVSSSKLEESKQRLSLLPYIKDVEMSVKPVSGKSDQVDVNYKVKEDNSAQASVKIGYSQVYHMIFGAGLNQKNFMGTGNTLGINFQRSRFDQYYGIDYTNPYYTIDGISRTISLSLTKTDPGTAANVNSSYTTNAYNFGVLYGIPVGQELGAINRILAGLGISSTLISLNPGHVSNQVNAFVTQNGRRYDELDFKMGYSRDSRDKAIFPTRGMTQSVFADLYAPFTNNGLTFYTLSYSGKLWIPLSDEFIILTRGDLAYGNGWHGVNYYPFFKNFYAGGIDSVRGYLGYNLGPRDSMNNAYGGNMLADASIALIFPNHLTDNMRTSVFVDAGNVYASRDNRNFGCQGTGVNQTCSTNSGPIRFSMGIEADWLTPLGPIQLSLAVPINPQLHDKREVPQFAMGANF